VSVLRRAVFLDRDGTIAEEVGYLNHMSRFRMFPFVAGAVRRLNEAGMPVIVVTNQSGVGRGYFPEWLVHQVHVLMNRQLAEAGARIDAVYFCPHTSEDACDCRKPKPGMLERAAQEHGIDVQRSFVVGDRYGDVELGHNAGARSILVRTGYGEGELAWQAATLAEATDWILEQRR
jgi:D-glycero-D-manno-heptose 1,7-bisphosphate phosphatase